MNELFDKLILRLIFMGMILALLLAQKKIFQCFHREDHSYDLWQNSAHGLYFCGHILGLGIILSEFFFKINFGLWPAMLDFLIWGATLALCYQLCLLALDSIVLFDFDYTQEVLKKNNLPYAFVSFGHTLGVAILLKVILKSSLEGPLLFLLFCPLGIVLLGIAAKTYLFMSLGNFNELLMKKNMATALSYTGFFLGQSLIISSALNQKLLDISSFSMQMALRILLSLILFPLFMGGFKALFKKPQETTEPLFNDGLYEGINFLTSALFTVVVTEQIRLGAFYP